MKIIPFPSASGKAIDEAWHAELEAALRGEGNDPAADSWRELRNEVRALAPPMDPDFERRLSEQIAERSRRPQRVLSAPELPRADAKTMPAPAATLTSPAHAGQATSGSTGVLGRLRKRRLAWVGILAPIGVATAAVILITGPVGHHTNGLSEAVPSSVAREAPPRAAFSTAGGPGVARGDEQASGASVTAPGRIQQFAASVSLTAAPSDVQSTADRVARLIVSDGGFVQSSHVQTQQHGSSEADLVLKLPSAKLSAALASLGELAPVRAESQSSQDITDSYNAARRGLTDAIAERQALLRVLARATTQGQIDSLREQLSQVRGAITHARDSLRALSRRASTAELEVTVVGEHQSESKGLTLKRGVNDAKQVLTAAAVVLLIVVAVLVPLGLVLAVLTGVRRAWRGHLREGALDER
jgi:Domain of unknown function (DUF4349)